MADDQELRDAIGAIQDPLLHRPLSQLGMVAIAERRRIGADRLTVSVPVPNYPVLDELEHRIQSVLDATGRQAEVTVEVMDDAGREAMMAALRADAPPRVGETGSRTRVVAVASGKGGVGKSSVTTNLAVALARRGHSVGVIDGDIWGFSIPRMLGISQPPVVIDQSIIPPEAHGVKAMSMDYFVPDDKAVIWRGPMLHKAIEQFLQDVWWDDLDFLIVDMPPGTGDIAISMSQFLPRAQVLLVTTPQPTAQRVAKRAALMAAQVNQEVMGVVENMSWFTGDDGVRYEIFGSGGGQALADELDVPLMGRIPLVPSMREGADRGAPVYEVAPDSESTAAFEALADAVLARKPRVRTHPELVIR
ncbi:MAG TPA: Mrp/NBP35 family ATP-binding protein [Acidimicrobiia bacterium]|nr:Mrp/NBP35 family ATP-binding protein [Acidimicrobiia bacterium]